MSSASLNLRIEEPKAHPECFTKEWILKGLEGTIAKQCDPIGVRGGMKTSKVLISIPPPGVFGKTCAVATREKGFAKL